MSKTYSTAGAVLTFAMIVAVAYVTLGITVEFPQAVLSSEQVAATEGVDLIKAMGAFLWGFRSMDLLTQAVVLLGTAVGCTAMIRVIRREK